MEKKLALIKTSGNFSLHWNIDKTYWIVDGPNGEHITGSVDEVGTPGHEAARKAAREYCVQHGWQPA